MPGENLESAWSRLQVLWKRLVMKKMCPFRRFVVLCLWVWALVGTCWCWLMMVDVGTCWYEMFFQCIILFVSVACYFVANGCYWLMSCILWNPLILPKDLWEIPQQVKHIVRWHAVTLWMFASGTNITKHGETHAWVIFLGCKSEHYCKAMYGLILLALHFDKGAWELEQKMVPEHS